jgi:small subunit ribosomal protein S16
LKALQRIAGRVAMSCVSDGAKNYPPRASQISLSRAQFSKEFIMVVIRLSRGGSKGRPFFNIVVAAKRERRDGRFIERLGFHNPSAAATEEGTRINTERLAYWTSVGAQVSPTVARLVKQTAAKAA